MSASLAREARANVDCAPMPATFASADILTSARMAAGMTSRARRPESRQVAG